MNESISEIRGLRLRFLFGCLLVLSAIPTAIFIAGGVPLYGFMIPVICLIQLYLIYRLRNAQLLMIITLYTFIYFLYLIPYFLYNIQLSEHNEFQNFNLFQKVLFLFYLFYTGFVWGTVKEINPEKKILAKLLDLKVEKWKQILYLCVISGSFFFTFRQGSNVLLSESAYATYRENLDNTSALPLFMVLFIYLLFYIVRESKKRNVLLSLALGALTLYCITRGFRMILAPLFLLIFHLYLDLKFKVKYILLLFLGGFTFLILINSLKMGMQLTLKDIFSEGKGDFIISHHADNLYVSAAGIGLIKNGEITMLDRLFLSIGFFMELIIPPALIPDAMKYPHIISLHSTTGGGGLCITACYFMWGYVGVLLFPFLLCSFIRRTYETQNNKLILIAGIILCFFPRWISYDFHIILRFSFIGFVLYYCLKYIVIKYEKKSIGYQ